MLAYAWNWLAKAPVEEYWYYFPIGAAVYFAIGVILSLFKIQWEWDVAIQVAFVLAPVLWYVNIKDPYKPPVYVFVVNSGYTGKLDIIYNQDKEAFTNAHSTADTLYFNFDNEGQILLNEQASYVKECMHNYLFCLNHDGSKTRILPAKINALPTDTTKLFLLDDSVIVVNGKMREMRYRVDFPQRLKSNSIK